MPREFNKEAAPATKARVPDEAVPGYLREMLVGMTDMARSSGHGLLAYLLEVAAQEAAQQARKP